MATWITGALVAAILALAAAKLIRDRRRGKSCGGCGGCDSCDACTGNKKRAD